MKIPKKVKVGPFTYRVVWYDQLRSDEVEKLFGQCITNGQPHDHEIRIERGHTDERTTEVFLHEVIHAIDYYMRIGLDEDQTLRLGNGLAAVLMDHGLLKE